MQIDCRPRQNMPNNPLLQPRCVGLEIVTPIMCHLCEQGRSGKFDVTDQILIMKQWHELVDIALAQEEKERVSCRD